MRVVLTKWNNGDITDEVKSYKNRCGLDADSQYELGHQQGGKDGLG